MDQPERKSLRDYMETGLLLAHSLMNGNISHDLQHAVYPWKATVAEGSVSGVLDGKQYNRAVRVHKYVYEALIRLARGEFLNWLEKSERQRPAAAVRQLLERINGMASDLKKEVF